ncbi:uncharacterized protein LTR77_008757 [Saxophila tyrrhenica]|uniref:Uncharacterized protein n=1 Tax=Saxophila tyrrhenica TaxID=1690608 RepID=A0AAV9P0T3_9PEZI|nr:hypothetical protein LTR77_008757 [Saxophila tyrrhenica]
MSRCMVIIQAVANEQPNNGSEVFAQDLHIFEAAHMEVTAGYFTWLDYALDNNTDIWRELVVQVKRYGYGWSFDGFLVYFATAALLTQALLTTVHIVAILSGRWTSNAWSSMASMLAMALRSQRSAVPADLGNGHEQSRLGLSRAETFLLLER